MTDTPRTPQSPQERARQFRTIFEAEHGYVWNSLRRLGVRERDLADVTHDVFVALFRTLAQFDASRPIRPYLFGIAFRVASDYRRLARNKNELLDPDEPRDARDSTPGADENVSRAEDCELVHSALQHIEPERRAVLLLHDIDETPMPQIAEALGVPLNTGYSRLRLARQDFEAAVRALREGRNA